MFPVCYAVQLSLSSPTEKHETELASRKFYCEDSFTPRSLLLHEVYMCDGLLRIQIFLLCIPLFTPSRQPGFRRWAERQAIKLQMQCGVITLTQFVITGHRTHYC